LLRGVRAAVVRVVDGVIHGIQPGWFARTISHRSGEIGDTFIADLVAATNADAVDVLGMAVKGESGDVEAPGGLTALVVDHRRTGARSDQPEDVAACERRPLVGQLGRIVGGPRGGNGVFGVRRDRDAVEDVVDGAMHRAASALAQGVARFSTALPSLAGASSSCASAASTAVQATQLATTSGLAVAVAS
jgi:hypothetical protein